MQPKDPLISEGNRAHVKSVLDGHPNALFEDTHVVLSSGRHSDFYFDKRVPLRDPVTCDAIGNAIANIIKNESDVSFTAVVAPAYGAITMGLMVALRFRLDDPDVKFFVAEKAEDGGFKFNSSDAAELNGRHVLVIEDVNTTAETTLLTLDALEVAGATPEIVTTLVDRSNGRAEASLTERDVEFVPILTMEASDWAADECDLCKQGVPVNEAVGHPEYLVDKT